MPFLLLLLLFLSLESVIALKTLHVQFLRFAFPLFFFFITDCFSPFFFPLSEDCPLFSLFSVWFFLRLLCCFRWSSLSFLFFSPVGLKKEKRESDPTDCDFSLDNESFFFFSGLFPLISKSTLTPFLQHASLFSFYAVLICSFVLQ